MKPRLGLVGVGSMGQIHLKLLRGSLSDRADLVAVCDVRQEALEEAKRMGVKAVYTDYHEMLEKESLDGVIIATPPHLHPSQAVEALRRGLYVLLEKPVAPSMEGVRRVVENAGGRLMVAFSLRFHELYEKVKRLLDTRLGRVVMQWHIALGKLPPTPWIRVKAMSGGMVNENSIHVLYVFYWYAGRVREVYARLWSLTEDVDIEDNAAITLVHEDGAVSMLVHTWTAGHRWRKWGVQAEKGTVTCEGYLSGQYRVSLRSGEIIEEGVYDKPIEDMYARQLSHFIDCIVNGWKPVVNEDDALHVHMVIDAVHQSAARGEPVKL